MKTLLIMRHAKSSWSNSFLSDHERPLNGRGKENAPRMGKHLKHEACVPQLIISSTAKRAATTAEMVAIASGYEGDITYLSDFYLADPETYIETLNDVLDVHDRVMVVGHNPGMEELVDDLTDTRERFTTANIAQVELPIDSWADLTLDVTGKLVNLWRPREL